MLLDVLQAVLLEHGFEFLKKGKNMFVIEQIKNPKWMNAEHTLLECEVKFAEAQDFLPFGASFEGDQYEHTKEVFKRASSGEFGEVAEFVPPPAPSENQPTVGGAQTL